MHALQSVVAAPPGGARRGTFCRALERLSPLQVLQELQELHPRGACVLALVRTPASEHARALQLPGRVQGSASLAPPAGHLSRPCTFHSEHAALALSSLKVFCVCHPIAPSNGLVRKKACCIFPALNKYALVLCRVTEYIYVCLLRPFRVSHACFRPTFDHIGTHAYDTPLYILGTDTRGPTAHVCMCVLKTLECRVPALQLM